MSSSTNPDFQNLDVSAAKAATLLANPAMHSTAELTAPPQRVSEKPLLMIPGPIEFDSEVLEAGIGAWSHTDPAFIEVFGKCLDQLKEVFLAPDGLPIVFSGSGTLGWDSIAANLIEPGDNVVVLNSGYFGDSFVDCLRAYGADVTVCESTTPGEAPSLDSFRALLDAGLSKGIHYKLVTLTHVDTSTGVLTDPRAVADIVHRYSPNTLVVVDGVCSIGGEELRMEEWGVDVAMTASQKCIGVPPGLTLLMVRPRALAVRFEGRKAPVMAYYVDWGKWVPIMKAYMGRMPSYFATPAVNLIQSLSVALDQLLSKSMSERFLEQRTIGHAIRAAIRSLGLQLVPTGELHAANTLTCVYLPDGISLPTFLPAVRKAGAILAGGLHKDIKTKYFRIGAMGPSIRNLEHVRRTLQAVEEALLTLGFGNVRKGALVEALEAALPSSFSNTTSSSIL